MLKEAIAEAKTIKETAIANAKAALEEAFTPQLTAMFAERLNEEDEMEQEGMYETTDMEDEGLEENFNLDEILAELSETDDTDKIDEDLMLEEMSDEEIEELVMKVIDDMIETGKLMPGEGEEEEIDADDLGDEDVEIEDEIDEAKKLGNEFGGNKVPLKFEDSDSTDWIEDKTAIKGKFSDKKSKGYFEVDEDVSLDELLNELLGEEKEELNEDGAGSNPLELLQALIDPAKWEVASNIISRFLGTDAGGATVASILVPAASLPFIGPKIKEKFKDVIAKVKAKTNEAADTTEMEETISELRNELNEVNLLNAKLLYTNKIFKAKNLTESEKVKVLNTFDKAETVKEVKLVFETLNESFKATAKKAPIKESLGSASRSMASTQTKQPIIEVNDAFARMQRLAGLRK